MSMASKLNMIDENITPRSVISKLRYQIANDIVGALICSAQELKRRHDDWDIDATSADMMISDLYESVDPIYEFYIAPMEDLKIEENGDIRTT